MISKSFTDRLIIVPPMTIRIGQGSPGSLMVILSTTIHALTMGRIIVPVCVSWSTTLKRIRKGSGSTLHHTRSTRISFSRIRPDWRVALPYRCIETRLVMRWLISQMRHPSLVRREYSSPIIRIVLVVTAPSVLKMMQGRMVRMVANMEVSLLLCTWVLWYANVMMLIEMPYIINAVSPSMKHVRHLYTYCLIRESSIGRYGEHDNSDSMTVGIAALAGTSLTSRTHGTVSFNLTFFNEFRN
jgi:hypothetical protein